MNATRFRALRPSRLSLRCATAALTLAAMVSAQGIQPGDLGRPTRLIAPVALNVGPGGFPVPTDVVTGDFGSPGGAPDGIADILVGFGNTLSGGLSVSFGTGAPGAFAAPVLVSYSPQFVGSSVTDLVTADFDQDGTLDVAAYHNFGVIGIEIFLNGAGGLTSTWSVPTSVTALTAFNSHQMAAGVIVPKGAGSPALPDLVWADGAGITLAVNLGGGVFLPLTVQGPTNGAVPLGAQSVAVADLDADGDLDLATAWVAAPIFGGNGRVSASINIGAGAFTTTFFGLTSLDSPTSMVLADVIGGPELDAIVVQLGSVEIVPGTVGGFSFGTAATNPVIALPAAALRFDVEAFDMDSDGLNDIVVEGAFGSLQPLRNFQNSGCWRLDPAIAGTTAGGTVAFDRSLDTNGDGALDLISVSTLTSAPQAVVDVTTLSAYTVCQSGLGLCSGGITAFGAPFVGLGFCAAGLVAPVSGNNLSHTLPAFTGTQFTPAGASVIWTYAGNTAPVGAPANGPADALPFTLIFFPGSLSSPWTTSPFEIWMPTFAPTQVLATGVTNAAGTVNAGGFVSASPTVIPGPNPALQGYQFATQALIFDPVNAPLQYWVSNGVVGSVGW